MDQLREKLQGILVGGMAADPLLHAEQVARVAGVLHEAFTKVGLRCTLVGGSAIEVHAPGVYKSGDVDLVIDSDFGADLNGRIKQVFEELGFKSHDRHWTIGDLFVEVPSHDLSDPAEVLRYGDAVFEVVTKEVVLADRIVGFKQWGYTGFGQQAIDMLAAFGDHLDMSWLEPKLRSEDSWDAFEAIRSLAQSEQRVTDETLTALLGRLRRKP